VWQGARTLGLPLEAFFVELKRAGLGTLPGTAAEILDDEVRVTLCPDKVRTGEWLEVMRTAHRMGFRTTSTIMFGHMERLEHWARHLLRLRALQAETGGFTEFVPLPFVHMEAPIYRKGRARRGPTFREAVLMHAVARLALYPLIPNIQASWVKMGPDGVKECLRAGANDLGGTLMNESISRAAGASHGQEMTPAMMEGLIHAVGRTPRERTTLYAASTRGDRNPRQLQSCDVLSRCMLRCGYPRGAACCCSLWSRGHCLQAQVLLRQHQRAEDPKCACDRARRRNSDNTSESLL
jgi:FO synthase